MLRGTMAGYSAKNKKTIERAFAKFRKEDEDIIRHGMLLVAKAGIDYLVEAHTRTGEDLNHPKESDSMGYAVAHNGMVIASYGYSGDESYNLPRQAREEAERLLAGTTGWRAIILSDMEGWYNVDWEEGFLSMSADEIKNNFTSYFKPIR